MPPQVGRSRAARPFLVYLIEAHSFFPAWQVRDINVVDARKTTAGDRHPSLAQVLDSHLRFECTANDEEPSLASRNAPSRQRACLVADHVGQRGKGGARSAVHSSGCDLDSALCLRRKDDAIEDLEAGLLQLWSQERSAVTDAHCPGQGLNECRNLLRKSANFSSAKIGNRRIARAQENHSIDATQNLLELLSRLLLFRVHLHPVAFDVGRNLD